METQAGLLSADSEAISPQGWVARLLLGQRESQSHSLGKKKKPGRLLPRGDGWDREKLMRVIPFGMWPLMDDIGLVKLGCTQM